MIALKDWQLAVLAAPIALLFGGLIFLAGMQLHAWGLSWLWAVVTLGLAGWRWLLVRWTRPAAQLEAQVTAALVSLEEEMAASGVAIASGTSPAAIAQAALEGILRQAEDDWPLWEDWPTFWQRAQQLVEAIARACHPEVDYPLLEIYVTQAYGLLRDTTYDLDRWLSQLAPLLDRVTVAGFYRSYLLYRRLQPSAQRAWQVWNWAQWILNPAAAIARTATQGWGQQANRELLGNFSQLLREVALRQLAARALALYGSAEGGATLPPQFAAPDPRPHTAARRQSLREILERAEPVERLATAPVELVLVGRTGAGKSSVINGLFRAELALTDALPSTSELQAFRWQLPALEDPEAEQPEELVLWDAPGYEQVDRPDLRAATLTAAARADVVVLVTPALDPALQADRDFLQAVRELNSAVPVLALVSQVDRLRPLREWQPPYDWRTGDRPKEQAIREAVAYRQEILGAWVEQVLPVVLPDVALGRAAWGLEAVTAALLGAIDPAKQIRLARFLGDREARSLAAARLIDRAALQMSAGHGATTLLKSPVLKFISTLTTGSAALAEVLAAEIPVEQVPVVGGKLQLAWELYRLLDADSAEPLVFDLRLLWPLVAQGSQQPERDAWALGQVLLEYWTGSLPNAPTAAGADWAGVLGDRLAFYRQGG